MKSLELNLSISIIPVAKLFSVSTRFVDDIYCVSVQRKDRAGEWYNNRLYCGRGVRSPRYVGGGLYWFSVFEWIKVVFTRCSFRILTFILVCNYSKEFKKKNFYWTSDSFKKGSSLTLYPFSGFQLDWKQVCLVHLGLQRSPQL